MTDSDLYLRSTALSDVGYVRSNNQDSAFAGSALMAIADGMGGHAGGDTASTIAIRTLGHLERTDHRRDIAATVAGLEKSILVAHDAIVGDAKKEHELAGMGTTVDAVTLVRGYWVLAHIGDSRAYLLRGGRLIQVSKDHSYVQHLIDSRLITPGEAKNHPQRNVVMRVLGDFDIDPHPDISVRQAQAGDRWLLCSDGLCGPLEDETIQEVLASTLDREECAQRLVNMALKAGSTDNVSAVIGDTASISREDGRRKPASRAPQVPLIGGAAQNSLESIAEVVRRPVASAPSLRAELSPAQKAADLLNQANSDQDKDAPTAVEQLSAEQQVATPTDKSTGDAEDLPADTGEIPIVLKADGSLSTDPSDPDVVETISKTKQEEREWERRHRFRRRIVRLVAALVVLLGLAIGVHATWDWTQRKYYLTASDGVVAIYQGVPTSIFGIQLSHKVKATNTKVSSLPQLWRESLTATPTTFDSFQEAFDHAEALAQQAHALDDKDKDKDKDADKSQDDDKTADQSNADGGSASGTASDSSDTTQSAASTDSSSGASTDTSNTTTDAAAANSMATAITANTATAPTGDQVSPR